MRCEGRTIGLHMRLGSINYALILGKDFEIEIGRIGKDSLSYVSDSNGNNLESNVKFQRSFANINLITASSSFRLLLEDFPCASNETGEDTISDQIAQEILSLGGLSNDNRITIDEVTCNNKKKRARSQVQISPPSTTKESLRRLGENKVDIDLASVDIFETIQSAITTHNHLQTGSRKLNENRAVRKKLSYFVSDVQVMPSKDDLEKIKTHPDKEHEESVLYHLASQIDFDLENVEGIHDFILTETRNEREEMKHELNFEREKMKHELDLEREEIKQELEVANIKVQTELEEIKSKLNKLLQLRT